MSENEQRTRWVGWTEWSRRHLAGLSIASHTLLFVVAWFLAFGLAYNFKASPTLGRPVVWVKSLFTQVAPAAPGGADWLIDFFLPLLLPVVAIKLTVFFLLGLHRTS